MRRRLWMLLALLTCVSSEYLMGGHLDNNAGSRRSGKIENSPTSGRQTRLDDLDLDLMAEESAVAVVGATSETLSDDSDDVPRYHIPYPFAFNGGKPFSLEKDPITGKIDFEKAPPVKALNYTDYRENKESQDDPSKDRGGNEDPERKKSKGKGKDNEDVSPNEINTYANFHDFLNLPVHYSSDKYGNDKYPLISSSYANTKVQSGSNSYSTYNHRPYHPENDLYVRPVKHSYTPITKTSTHKTTAIEEDKVKWSPSTTFLPIITTNSSRTMLSTSTRAPAVTTWKPSNTPVSFHTIDRTELENEKNLLPIEKLHVESHRNPSNVPTRTPNDGAMTEKTQTTSHLHKDHSNLDNFVLSHARPETKPTQSEEYSYDTYELPEGESESEGGNDGNSEETDYFLPFKDLLKEITSVSSTTASPTASTAATTTTSTTTTTAATSTMTDTASSTRTTTTTTTMMPSRSVSSTSSTPEDALVNNRLQFPIISSSLNSDRRQSVTESHQGIIGHGYRPTSIKLEPNRIGAGTVIESTSNIVIPPDQDTVSFVLGNRQSVEGGYYSVGTAVGENPYGTLSDLDTTLWPLHNDPHGPTKIVKHEYSSAHSATESPGSDRVTQKWWPPSPLKTSNEIEPPKSQSPLVAIASAVIQDTRNRSKEKDSGYVIFPDENETKDKDTTKEEHIVVINEADGSIREITPKTTTLTTTTIGGDLPQLAEDLIPPAESSRPPSYYHHYQYDMSRPDHSRLPQRTPLPPPPSRIKPPHSAPPPDAGLRKRPYSPDTKLPNILPQFRPNAKASHGHRGPDAIGTMPAGQPGSSGTRVRQPLPSHSSTSRRPLPPPSYLQRLNPPPPPIHAVRLAFVPTSNGDSIASPHETESTIRTRLRPPHSSISRIGLEENKLFTHGKNSESRKEDHGKSEIADENEERYPEEPPMTPPRPPLFPKRRTADPPRVATLQMIQQHGELIGENEETDESVESVLPHEAERRKSDNHDPAEIPEQPVYVVYPVNTAVNILSDDSNEKDGSVVVGTRGPHRPLPPDTLLQNEPAEETHTVYNGRPLAALDFPYPLERPDPSSVFPAAGVKETPLLIPSKQRSSNNNNKQQQQQQASTPSEQEKNEKDEQVDSVNVIPYLQDFLPTFNNKKKNDAAISVTLHRTAPIASASTSASTSTLSTSTSTPIAYVYTPTNAPYSIHRLDDDVNDDDEDAATKQTVLLPSQQPSSSSSSAPAPQNFMAPFVASLSAETPSKNDWSVVVVEGAERKSDSDGGEAKVNSESETQTEKNEFDADNFKPQLFGGFKPIYEFPTEDAARRDVADTNAEVDTPRNFKKLLSVSDKG
ncbi:LOW QUALITY PROTEIN: mucin-5AC-like [Nylanderia fulva]|uniref:LOW QUALITY PROTEIN: mucin-5AC-like n=1 Tax=Nylanderia fulva TaxID=613905 RepID=UPI0010FB1616|nr:LOW QUALITY PROTEIN: mucin-5AC-like [Nylanderia fulva]